MSFKASEIVSILDIVNLALIHGVPAVMSIVSTWNSDAEITPEMIAELLKRIEAKPASELFTDD